MRMINNLFVYKHINHTVTHENHILKINETGNNYFDKQIKLL